MWQLTLEPWRPDSCSVMVAGSSGSTGSALVAPMGITGASEVLCCCSTLAYSPQLESGANAGLEPHRPVLVGRRPCHSGRLGRSGWGCDDARRRVERCSSCVDRSVTQSVEQHENGAGGLRWATGRQRSRNCIEFVGYIERLQSVRVAAHVHLAFTIIPSRQ